MGEQIEKQLNDTDKLEEPRRRSLMVKHRH